MKNKKDKKFKNKEKKTNKKCLHLKLITTKKINEKIKIVYFKLTLLLLFLIYKKIKD
jgi:hypothetical protein